MIGAGSLVNKDILDNSIAAGVLAKVIGDFNSFVNKRIQEPKNIQGPKGEEISKELQDKLWDAFIKRDKQNLIIPDLIRNC